jgi:hypothetical protein
MPDIDVSELLFDPDIADVFDVVRRSEVVGADGRATVSPVRHRCIVGSVQATGDGGLQRRDDGQMMPRSISIVTVFRLRGPAPGFQPDQIIFDGVTYTVNEIMPMSRFGRGFIEATAISMNAGNPPVI